MSDHNSSRGPVTDQLVNPSEEEKKQIPGTQGEGERALEVTTVESSASEPVVEEAKPLSAMDAYRLDRERMFAERLRMIKEKEAFRLASMREASMTMAPVTAPMLPSEQLPAVQSESDNNGVLARPVESVAFVPAGEHRPNTVLYSALIFVGIPVLLAIIYFGFIASNQYAATAQFSIHINVPPTAGGAATPVGLTSLISGGASGASMMAVLGCLFEVQQYLQSPQALRDIKPYLDLRTIYSRPGVDYWARLHDPSISDGGLLKYWQSMVQMQVDNNTGLASLTVRAFTPTDAKAIADRVLALSEDLVNKMSDRAQNDTIGLAQKEVDSTYKRVLDAHKAMTAFNIKQSHPSPDDDATQSLTERDRLILDLNFAEQAYSVALTTLESARLVASGQGLYIETFAQPQAADYAEYPSRFQDVLLTLMVSGLTWVLGSLIVAAIKEHL